jgi:hypothetical protein
MKSRPNIRAYDDDNKKIQQIARELSVVQQKKIGSPEVLRRALNIPDFRNILIKDAELKRRLGK